MFNKNYQQNFDEKLEERFFNTHNFSNHGNNKFFLSLRKGVYPYIWMIEKNPIKHHYLKNKTFTVT